VISYVFLTLALSLPHLDSSRSAFAAPSGSAPRALRAGEVQIQVLRSEDPATARFVAPAERADVLSLFRFDEAAAETLFKGSQWLMGSDAFHFTPSVETNEEASREIFELSGTTVVGEGEPRRIELHGRRQGPRGSVFTLDGLLEPKSTGYRLEGVFSIVVRGFLQVGRVVTDLTPLPAGAKPKESMPGGSVPPKVQFGGISLPAWFAVRLAGDISGAKFPERSAVLSLFPTAHAPTPMVAVSLGDGKIEAGSLLWNSSGPIEGAAAGSPTLVQRVDGKTDPVSTALWWGPGRDAKLELASLFQVTDGRLILSLEGGRVRGEIYATGVDSNTGQVARYRGKFTGEPTPQPVPTDTNSPYLLSIDKVIDIGGFPVPSVFDLTLAGQVDGDKFGPIEGQMRLDPAESGDSNPLSLELFSQNFGALALGSISLAATTSGDAQIRVAEGRLELSRASDAAVGVFNWGTINPESADHGLTSAFPLRAALTLEIANDRINGSLDARGFLATGEGAASRYHARITGQRRHPELIERMAPRIGLLPLAGRWHSSVLRFDPIQIDASGNQRTGRLGPTHSGRLVGTLSQDVLRFTWKDGTGAGWGFLRPVTSGALAIGFWGEDKGAAQLLVAEQAADSATQPSTADELLQFNRLGRDLASQGRCDQAMPLLQRALDAYRARRNVQETTDLARQSDLIGATQVIEPILNCDFSRGDYPSLVRHLRTALAVKRELLPEEAARRMFQARSTKLVHSLDADTKTLGLLAGNLDAIANKLDPAKGAGVGVRLDGLGVGTSPKVGPVMPGGPAAKAGVLEGDRIDAIDGASTAVMSAAEVISALSGLDGSTVRLTIMRKGATREINVVRRPLGPPLSPERRQRVVDLYHAMAQAVAETRAQMQALRTEITTVSPETPDPLAALRRLREQTAALAAALAARVEHLINLGEVTFGDWRRVMISQRRLFAYVLGMVQASAAQKPAGGTEADLQKLEHLETDMLAAVKNDPAIPWVEADLFRLHYMLVPVLTTDRVDLAAQVGFLDRWGASRRAEKHVTAEQKKALLSLSRLSARLERARAQMVSDNAKVWALDAGRDFFGDWIGLLWDLGGQQAALTAAEAARNRAAQDLFAGREKVLKALQSRAGEGLRSPVAEPPLSDDQVLALTRARGGTTVAYYGLPNRLLVWVIRKAENSEVSQQTMKAIALSVTQHQITGWVSSLQALVARPQGISPSDGSAQTFAALLREMYGALIAPIRQWLPDDPEEVVTVIPDGALFRVPFGALLEPVPTGTNRSPHYLIQDHPLAYLPSIGLMRYTRSNWERAVATGRQDLVALVDPTDISYSGLTPFPENGFCNHMVDTYYQRTVHRSLFFGPDATAANLRRTAQGARVLCFLAHAIADETHPEESFIALSGAPFKLDDMYRLDLTADLVILAACETGRGKLTGDGVIGFNRAFTWAGAASLLMTLWEVPPEETELQLDRFQHYLQAQPHAKARALQAAQIEMIKNYPEQPNLWAAALLFGEP
jgi:CHAT domain-containing protein